MRLACATCLATGLAGAVAAADGPTIDDVRVLGGLGRGTVSARADLYTNSAIVGLRPDGDADVIASVAVTAVTSFGEMLGPHGGLIGGIELGYHATSAQLHANVGTTAGINYDLHSSTIGGDVLVGWAVPFGAGAHVELTPYLGVGRQREHVVLNTPGTTIGASGWGTDLEYGLRGAAYRTFANRFQIGLEIRYGREQADHRIDIVSSGTTTGTDTKVQTDAVTFVIGVGRRF